jgi:uncharacterized protein YkwD
LRRLRRALAGFLLAGVIVPSAAPAASPEGTVVRAINKIRAAHGLSPLKRSQSLHHSSSHYARQLMLRDVFAHQSRIAVAGRFEWAGENLELHWGWRPRPRYTVSRWMGSPAHRAVILSSEWRWVGVGRSRGLFQSNMATIWVAHFGKL